jgi:hypothetical protein
MRLFTLLSFYITFGNICMTMTMTMTMTMMLIWHLLLSLCSKMFLFPVLKEDGHMWMLSQFQDTAFIVTYLGGTVQS